MFSKYIANLSDQVNRCRKTQGSEFLSQIDLIGQNLSSRAFAAIEVLLLDLISEHSLSYK